MSSGIYPYDLVPFRSTSVPNADCRRIEMVARLFGLAAVPCAQSRVLELGCGSAANLIPLALQHPQASFIGCDLSQSALASAQRTIDRLGLANVELRHVDICDVDQGWGCFDYIICHDVFCWVPAEVRQEILAILSRNLAAHGVGSISYDVLPGWRLRGIVRDMMRYHAAGLSDPREAVAQARAILAMAAAVQDQRPGPYAELLREEYYLFSRMGDDQLYHLAFSEHHQPFHAHEFVGLLDGFALQQVSDSDVTRLFGPREPAAARGFLDGLPPLPRQQYADFLTNCTSRSALVCHRDVQIRSRPDERVLRDSWISLATAPRGDQVVPDPVIQEALSSLEKRRPEYVAFRDLTDSGASSTGVFMDAYAAGLIDVVVTPARVSGRISDYPMVSPLVRLQAEDGAIVTNQKCEAVRLTGLARHVVALLDGAHHRDDVARSVAHEMASGRVANEWILRLGDDDVDAGPVAANTLRHLRDYALLVG